MGWPDLAVAYGEAQRTAARADAGRPFVRFEELLDEGMLGLLESSGGAAVARRMLQPLLDRPPRERALLLQTTQTWLEHNCAWDPAARKLGVHRHTLRNRIDTVEQLLGIDLGRFGDRAELWAAIRLSGDTADGR